MNDKTQNYPPGTLAVATVHGAPDVRVFRLADEDAWRSEDDIWYDNRDGSNDWVTDIRPQVVLNLSPHEVMRALEALKGSNGYVAIEVAKKLRAATEPPKPAEPGLWAVVEARVEGIPRRRWVHHEEDRWVCDTGERRYWADLEDPTLIREGVTA